MHLCFFQWDVGGKTQFEITRGRENNRISYRRKVFCQSIDHESMSRQKHEKPASKNSWIDQRNLDEQRYALDVERSEEKREKYVHTHMHVCILDTHVTQE